MSISGSITNKLLRLVRIDHLDEKLSGAQNEVILSAASAISEHCRNVLKKEICRIQFGRMKDELEELCFIASLDIPDERQFSKQVELSQQMMEITIDEDLFICRLKKSIVPKSSQPFKSFNKK